MKDFRDRIAVVTGAAGGIGLGAVERFLAEGMKVVMADIEPETLDRECHRLSESGGDVLGVVCDVRNPDAVSDLAKRTISHYGAVHVLMNNAGVAPAGPMLDTSPADWRWIIDVNVLGVAYGIAAFGPILRDAGAGHIINTASEAGLVTSAVLGMYSATKHAVVGMTESLYRELEDTNVGVHCLCPNLVSTKIFQSERNRDDGVEMKASQTAMIGTLREAASSIGIGVSEVAGDIMDALRANQFWIFTHELTRKSLMARFEDIQANRNPTNPYEGLEELQEITQLR